MAIRLEKDYRVLVLVVSYRTLIALQFRFIQETALMLYYCLNLFNKQALKPNVYIACY